MASALASSLHMHRCLTSQQVHCTATRRALCHNLQQASSFEMWCMGPIKVTG